MSNDFAFSYDLANARYFESQATGRCAVLIPRTAERVVAHEDVLLMSDPVTGEFDQWYLLGAYWNNGYSQATPQQAYMPAINVVGIIREFSGGTATAGRSHLEVPKDRIVFYV